MLLISIPIIQSSTKVLWEIGEPDRSPSKFKLGPSGYLNYSSDAAYVVGASNVKDWPYIIPGPDDAWAHGTIHTDTIYFGLARINPNSECKFTVDFVDSQDASPPLLSLIVNGKLVTRWQAPVGNGDESISGKPETGKQSQWITNIPVRFLRNGLNSISIRNSVGSWAVFDSLQLEGSPDLATIPVQAKIIYQSSEPTEQAVLRGPRGNYQFVNFNLTNLGSARKVKIKLANQEFEKTLQPGSNAIEVPIKQVIKPQAISLVISSPSFKLAVAISVTPIRNWNIYLFPHSHLDIGYTNLQSDVVKLHERNQFDAIKMHKESANFPPNDQFRFNSEGTFVLDNLLKSRSPAEIAQVSDAMNKGILADSAAYANELTGLMRPEELMASYRFSRIISNKLGVKMDTATQSDVPGVTWGDVTALHQAEITNLVLMPNPGDRIGTTRTAWQDHPFWWLSPSGKSKVFVWETVTYGVGHPIRQFNGDRSKIFRTKDPTKNFVGSYLLPKLSELSKQNYPYQMLGIPWSESDNPPVDGDVPYAVKAWNEKYAVPHIIISTISNACRDFIKEYGPRIPVIRGDFSPYWEDGAGSAALETGENRANADRIIQGEALYACKPLLAFPANSYLDAWRNVILFSEHTWGAYNSVSDSESSFEKSQWAVKKGYVTKADGLSSSLISLALNSKSVVSKYFYIINTTSWPQTSMIYLSPNQSQMGNKVVTLQEKVLKSQRLKNGSLAVLVPDVPPFASIPIRVIYGHSPHSQILNPNREIRNSLYDVKLNPNTGAIKSIKSLQFGRELVNTNAKYDLNQYLYLLGSDVSKIKTTSQPEFEVLDNGPLVSKVQVTSLAPGAKSLIQTIELDEGVNQVKITDSIDKLPVLDKEGVHIAFPLNVPNGQVSIDMPWSLVRPDKDQIPGANKNWFCTQRYVDVSNKQFGVTCSSVDAPLIEVGGITANVLGSANSPTDWIKYLGPTQTFYSWALNNIWYTNYRASQQGNLQFRYVIQAHGPFRPESESKFGISLAQPLIVSDTAFSTKSLFALSNQAVIVTCLKPTDDGRNLIVRLWGASGKAQDVQLRWLDGKPHAAYYSDLTEKPLKRCPKTINVPGWGVVTLRVARN